MVHKTQWFDTAAITIKKKAYLGLKASVHAPLRGRLCSALLLLLLLVPQLLGVWVLQGLDGHSDLGAGLPLDAALVHHRRLYGDRVRPQHRKVEKELGAEVVVVGLHALLDLIGLGVQWDLKRTQKKRRKLLLNKKCPK